MRRKIYYVHGNLAICLTCLLLIFIQLSVLAAEAQPTVRALVQVFVNWDGSGFGTAIANDAAQYIDYMRMSSEALGSKTWEKLTEKERQEFAGAFKKLIEKRYYKRWHKIFQASKISFGQELTLPNGLIRLPSQVKLGEDVMEIDWDLSGHEKNAKLVNLTVDGKDLTTRAGRRLQSELSKRGFAGFMSWLNAQSASVSDHDS